MDDVNLPGNDLNPNSEVPAPPAKGKPGAYVSVFMLGLALTILICIFPTYLAIPNGYLDRVLIPDKPTPGWRTSYPTPEIWLPTPQSEMDVDRYVSLGIMLTKNEARCGDALIVWNKVIDYTDANYQAYAGRARCTYNLAEGKGAMSNYIASMESALADIDRAIALYPVEADFYGLRRDILIGLTNQYPYQVDHAHIYDLAAQNDRAFLMFSHLPKRRALLTTLLALDLINAGQCEEGMQVIQKFESLPDDNAQGCLLCTRAAGYACLGEMDKAVKTMGELLTMYPDSVTYAYYKALYLYQAGRKAEALALLDQSIAKEPGFVGQRYYLRALIALEAGDYEKADQDLQMGSGNTWDHSGLYQYVYAKIALERGNTKEGTEWLRSAEASMPTFMNALRKQIQQEMNQLGVEPLIVPLSPMIEATPIPTFIP